MNQPNYEAIRQAEDDHTTAFMEGNLLQEIRTLSVERVRLLLIQAYTEKIQNNYYVHEFGFSSNGKEVFVELMRKKGH